MPSINIPDDAIQQLFINVPHLSTAIIGIIIVITMCIVYRVIYKGDTFKILGLELKTDKCLKDLKEAYSKLELEFSELNQDSKQKSNIVKTINAITIELSKIVQCNEIRAFTNRRELIYNLILPAIISHLTKDKDNTHRVAIFIPDAGTDNLKIFRGLGFSPEGYETFRLRICNSAAGWVFQNGDTFCSGDVNSDGRFFKHHKSKDFNSLLCVPIETGEKTWGVLSLDGINKNSFTADDADYLRYFASTISILFALTYVIEDRAALRLERREVNNEEGEAQVS